VKASLRSFAESSKISRPAANKTIGKKINNKWVQVPKRWWNFQKNQSWFFWQEKYPSVKMSESVFYKLLRKECSHIKVCRRATDLCEICQNGKKARQQLDTKLNSIHLHCSSASPLSPSPSSASTSLSSSPCSEKLGVACVSGGCPVEQDLDDNVKVLLCKLRNNVLLAQLHQQNNIHQQQQFKLNKQNLKQGEAIGVIDFKENLHLNIAAEETGYNYYNKPQRAYFSLCVYYLDLEGQTQTKFFDCMSKELAKTSWWTQVALTTIFQRDEWKGLNISKLFLWMDNGPAHFRTYEFFEFLFNVQPTFKFQVEWNFFVEGHGKSICDTHFSKVSQALKVYSKQQDCPVVGSASAMTAITSVFALWQQQVITREKHKKQTTKHQNPSFYDLLLLKLDVPALPSTVSFLDFKDLKLYYHFQRTETKTKYLFQSSVLTGSPLLSLEYSVSEKARTSNKRKPGWDTPLETNTVQKGLINREIKRRKVTSKQTRNQEKEKEKEKGKGKEKEKEKENEDELEDEQITEQLEQQFLLLKNLERTYPNPYLKPRLNHNHIHPLHHTHIYPTHYHNSFHNQWMLMRNHTSWMMMMIT
jgi:hypothetical protein